MTIIQTLTIDDTTYVFTDNPEQDIIKAIELYEDENRKVYMGYEIPCLTNFEFLGKKYPCISLWHDNQDARDIVITDTVELLSK